MKARSLCHASAALMLFAAPAPAPAQLTSSFAYSFLKEAGCQVIPFGACDVLDQDNAINLFRAYQIMFMNRYCGSGHILTAKAALENGFTNDEYRCRQVLQAMGQL